MAAGEAMAFGFGDPWAGFGTQCNVVKPDRKGKSEVAKRLWFTHTGIDIGAAKGDEVRVNANLYYHSTHHENQWKDHVIACSAVRNGQCTSDQGSIYYDFLHLNAAKDLKLGQSLRGVVIGTIADLSNPHLHLSKRTGAFVANINYKGALPPAECNDMASKKGLPDFPENFVRPDSSVVTIANAASPGRNAAPASPPLPPSKAQPPRASPQPTRPQYAVRITNLDVSGEVFVNDNLAARASSRGDSGPVAINRWLHGCNNEIRFKLADPGKKHTYHFVVLENGRVNWEKSCGRVGRDGCNGKLKNGQMKIDLDTCRT